MLFGFSSWSQTNFDKYKVLQSAGPVPADFSTPTRTKIAQADLGRLAALSHKKRNEFVVQVNYTIDELLKSGLVTFGDPVSVYLQEIGDRLVANDPDLKGKLRFYTFNSNEANAFSTDQGMVFVTTGLIAQLTTEAQLAFVLAHEIVHYQEEHVIDMFDYATSNANMSYSEKVRFFTKYSRENEFSADQLGIKLYHGAGYAPEEITKTFDVLIYSYLPFEEMVFNKSYFNNQWLFVPEKVFSQEKIDISARDKYNDRFASHPNVAKRTEELEREIGNYSNWGTILNFSEEKFDEIRNICRFEFILNDVYENNAIDALYGIYIMETVYPHSRFLRNCKSQVWLELMKYEQSKELGDFSFDFQPHFSFDFDYEGQISVLAQGLNRLPKEAKIAMGLRIIRDNYLNDTTDAFAGKIWEKAIEMAALNDEFNYDHYSKSNFQQAVEALAEAKAIADSVAKTQGTIKQKWDKYQTIKNQKSGISIDEGIDSTKFYLYGISDLMNDSVFKKRFDFYVHQSKEKKQEEDEFFDMTDEEQNEYYADQYENRLHLAMDTVLLINPEVYDLKGYQRIDYPASDHLEDRFLSVVNEVAFDLDIAVKQLDRSNQQALTAADYNDLSILMRSLDKRVAEDGVNVFLLDQENLDSLAKKYGTNQLMLLELTHSKTQTLTPGSIALFTVLFPIGLVYFPVAILASNTTEYKAYVLDLSTGALVVDVDYYANEPASKKMIESRLNALFHQLKQEKDAY